MKRKFNRRDFLKLAGLVPLSSAAPRVLNTLGAIQAPQGKEKNVLVIVFDAFSAYHLSLNGYRRETTPNLARLSKQAIVYHNHYAAGSFTTPGTASLLTGTLPWTNRALQPNGTVIEPFVSRNIFTAFPNYYRIAYTHNPWANKLLEQFGDHIDELVPWLSLFLQSYDRFIQTLFIKDNDIATVSWTRNVNVNDEGYAYSLFLSHLYETLQENNVASLKKRFPRGIPSTGKADISFVLEAAIDWIGKRLPLIPRPFAGYFHFLPPHGPYRTPLEFVNKFSHDGFVPVEKPKDIFAEKVSKIELAKERTEYDEFLLYVDREFGRLLDYLKTTGLLDNTWVIFTSDHGEMFERGIDGHSTDALYQPLIRVPLLIFEPGRATGMDIHAPTSALDVLPTLAYLTGQKIPDWAEGTILPPYATANPDPERTLYVVRANKIEHYAPLTRTTIALIKGRYKLLYFLGYEERGIKELVKLFDVESDPEELVDLSQSKQDIAAELLNELKVKLAEVNKPYL